jgi:hypothetical protein
MELDAFTSRLGLGQGRVQPVTVPPGGGDWAFVLGEDEAARFFELSAGDHADVVQDTDLTGVDFVRTHLALRVPAGLPATLAWEASIIVDGAKLATFTAKPGRTRTFTDLAANVSKLSGLHQIGVRLELVGV